MDGTGHVETIGQKIRKRRKEMRITADGLGEMVGAHAQTINKIEQDEIQQSRYLIPICNVLGIDPSLLPPIVAGRGKRTGKQVERRDEDSISPATMRAPRAFLSYSQFPIFNSTADKNAMISSSPIDFMQRPVPLSNVTESYGVMIGTDAHAPAFKVGDIALIHPHLVARPGDDVLLRERKDGGKIVLAELTSVTATHYAVKEHKKTSRRISKKEFPICHRVIGKYSR